MALFSLLGKLGLDASSFNAGLKETTKRTQSWASGMKGQLAAAFSVGAVIAWAKATAGAADTIMNLADAYDVTTDKIQLMQEAAARNGVQAEQLLTATVKIGEARKRALEGDEKAASAFSRMGITMERLNDKSVDNYDLMTDIGKASEGSNRNFQHQADLVDLIGAKGVRLVAAIRQLEGLNINLVSKEQLETVDALGDKYGEVIESIKRANLSLFGELFGRGQKLLEGQIQSHIQFWTELSKGGTQSALRGLRAAEEGIRSAYVDGVRDSAPLREYPTAQGDQDKMPAGYTREGRSTGESFDVPVAPIARTRFDRPSTGDLARIGGLYFGADYNTMLLQSQQKQINFLSKIADSTASTVEVLRD